MEHNFDLEETLQAFLDDDEPTAIMSVQTLRDKLAESVMPEPPDTVPACPRAIREASKPVSGVRTKVTLGSYMKIDLRRRTG